MKTASVASGEPALAPVMAVRPVGLEDVAPLRESIVAAQRLLDELLATAGEDVPSSRRVSIERVAVDLRAELQLASAKVDAIRTLLTQAAEQRRLNREIGERYRAARRGTR